MTRENERYIFRTLEKIRDETHENNIMLKAIIRYLANEARNADNENIQDFGRNIFANLISNIFEINKFK